MLCLCFKVIKLLFRKGQCSNSILGFEHYDISYRISIRSLHCSPILRAVPLQPPQKIKKEKLMGEYRRKRRERMPEKTAGNKKGKVRKESRERQREKRNRQKADICLYQGSRFI
jgi:hypothetical protein